MSLAMLFPIVLIIIGFSFYFSYKLLSKINFNLNGTEILLFQLGFIGVFFGIYSNAYINTRNFGEIFIFIGSISFVFLAYYYILRMIKQKLFIKWQMFIVYIILLIINGYSLNYIPMTGWDGLAYALMFLFLVVGLFAFLLIINLITLIIRKVKKINIKNTNKFNIKKDLVVSLMIIAMFLPILYGTSFSSKIKYEEKKLEDAAKEKIVEYLNKKYGDGDFKIENISNYDNEYTFMISTNYFDETFQIEYEDNNIYSDEFLLKYYSYIYGLDLTSYYDLEEYLKKYIRHKYLSEYNIDIEFVFLNIDDKLLEYNFKDVKTLDDLYELADKRIKEVLIYKIFNENEIDDFCKFIIKFYEEFGYSDDILWFRFNYKNPFSDSNYYSNDGYLKNAGNIYLVYADSTPVQVNKNN